MSELNNVNNGVETGDEDQFFRYLVLTDRSRNFIEHHNLDHVPEWYQYKREKARQMRELGQKDFWENLDGNMPLDKLIQKILMHAMEKVEKFFK